MKMKTKYTKHRGGVGCSPSPLRWESDGGKKVASYPSRRLGKRCLIRVQRVIKWYVIFILCINQRLLSHWAISRAWRRLHVFASNSDWFIALFTSVPIGQTTKQLPWFWFYDTRSATALHKTSLKTPIYLGVYLLCWLKLYKGHIWSEKTVPPLNILDSISQTDLGYSLKITWSQT